MLMCGLYPYFTVMIALHFVFNMAYSKIIEAKMVFVQLIQRLFFNMNDNQKNTPKDVVIDWQLNN